MSTNKSMSIQVRGIRELARAFKKVDADIPKQMKVRFGLIAVRVVSVIRGRVPRGATGDAQASVMPRSSASGAAVAFGGTKAPYFPWLAWGGTTKRWPSGAIRRTFQQGDDRYVYPSLREERPELVKAAEEAVIGSAKDNGFEVKG